MRLTARHGFEVLRTVRSDVERVCGLLASPSAEALDRCAVVLESACSDLASCLPWASGARGTPEALVEARRLQAAVRRASHLLEIAQDYYAKWSRTLATLTSGYTPSGEAGEPVRRGLVSLTG